ncbi:MAG: serine--tRNA ligase [Flavobacteriaceae bacterium]|nr:serine--tRNA ligase [Flavobacteriaceae bacterium]MDZ4148921.1 serine--tRNA ligase [Flavobacteriaceae bacterium]
MLELSYLRENKTAAIAALNKRNINAEPLVTEAIRFDEERRALQTKLDEVLSMINKTSKEIGTLFQNGFKDEADAARKQATELKETAKKLEDNMREKASQLTEVLYKIPNTPQNIVPVGKSADDNEVVQRKGDIPQLHKNALPHWDLASKYNLIDFDLGNKITGAGFPVYRGKGARLQRALINFFIDRNTAAGYEEIQPPFMVNEASGFGTGQLPDKEGQMYHVTEDNLFLIPTAEVPVTNLFRDVLLNESDFPICCTAYTPCFRREAGSYGAHVRGLNRLHQFDKVEIVRIEHPDQSDKALDGMVAHVSTLLEDLGLPYRILRLCGGDMGFTSAITYDFEVYSTAQERWLEVSSVSNFETFQANRLKLRFRDKNGKNRLAHTLNGSALALPRIVASLLENYQTPEGIEIPEVLRPYTGFDRIV